MPKYALINKETGEIVEPDVLLIGNKPFKVDKGFVKVFVTFLKDIVENPKIAGKAIRLLFYMIEECMDYNDLTIRIIPKYAVKSLGISDRTYRNWIKDLIDNGIIIKIDNYTYIFKAYTVVKGSMDKAITKTQKKNFKNQRDSGQGETTTPEPETPELFSEKNFEEVK